MRFLVAFFIVFFGAWVALHLMKDAVNERVIDLMVKGASCSTENGVDFNCVFLPPNY